MDYLAPEGPVYQAGTLSGNPVAMEAGLAQIRELEQPGTYERLEQLGAQLEAGLCDAAAASTVPVSVNRVGSVATLFFTEGPVTDWESAAASDTEVFARYFRAMLEYGFAIAPSQFEALFISLAHTPEHITAFTDTAKSVLQAL